VFIYIKWKKNEKKGIGIGIGIGIDKIGKVSGIEVSVFLEIEKVSVSKYRYF
jgi:uncharacterized protein YuzE